jgi:Phage major capsid protein E
MAPLGPLATERINRVMMEIETRELVQQRLWRRRLGRVQATDEEILAKITTDVLAADIITDDAEAVVHGSDQFSFVSGRVPNFKHGRMFSQSMLRLLNRIEKNLASAGDRGIFDNYIVNSAQRLLQGIEDREEMVICQMLEDTGAYDRFGVKFSGMSWGMPATLKITVDPLWTVAATATPIQDILDARQASIDLGGPEYNRITLSLTALNNALATTEFQNRVKFGMETGQAAVLNLNYLSQEDRAILFGRMLNMTVEVYDAQTKVEGVTGAKVNTRFQSVNKVVLSFSGYDNNNAVWDFAIGEITEKLVARMANVDLGVNNAGGGQFGPFGYTTVANPQLNPPGIIQWAVDRGFPRKHMEEANAVLTVAA